MKIFLTDDVRRIDRYTIDQEGIPSRDLVRRVAERVSVEIMSRWRPSKPLIIFAGPGNNGADALAVARILVDQGYQPEVLLFNINGNALSRDCRLCRDELLAAGDVKFTEIVNRFEMPELTSGHLIIDGLFGSGLNAPLQGGFKTLVQYINEAGATVVSIDLPSGMSGDWNPLSVNRNIVHASLTLAVQFPRLAFFFADNHQLVGEWRTVDIGLSIKAIRSTPTKYHLVEEQDVRRVLHPRPEFSSKADFGSALIVAGSYGMTGAAAFAARAAISAGAGKVTVHAPRCSVSVLQTLIPEAMVEADKHDIVFTDWTPRFTPDALAVGPGIGTHDVTQKALELLLKSSKKPIVIDADALNCIAARPALLAMIPPLSVLTPHAGEFDRLFGEQTSAEARLIKAVEMSRKHNVIIVLKGRYTATVRPDGKVYFNASGSPALATPGSGDVLTGVITALIAQGHRPEIAALTAAFIHGRAGEIAAESKGEYGVLASDIANAVGPAIKSIMS